MPHALCDYVPLAYLSVFSEEFTHSGLTRFTFGNGPYQPFDIVLIRLDHHIIQSQENQSRNEAGPLVPVNEGMVLDDMKEVSRCHLIEITMEIASSESGSRHSQCGLKQPQIADARIAPITIYLIAMNL
jgi:hypothetical protein